MKLISKASYLLSALMLSLGSCSSEMENMVPEENVSGETVHFIVAASRENSDNTRTILTENNDGGLDCTWSQGDRILVTDTKGTAKGILSLKEFIGNDESKAYFEGNLQGVGNGKVTLNYYYLGTELSKVSDPDQLAKIDSPYTHSYAEQDGKFESLTDYDILSVQAEAIVSKGASYVDITLPRRISAAHFTLEGLPEDFNGDVVISGEGLMNKVSLPLTAHKVETSQDPVGSGITMKNVGKDFYMILLPNELASFDMKFTAEVNGTTYEGSFRVSKQIGAAKYYRKNLNNGEGGKDQYVGLTVNMTPAKQYRVIYHINITDIDHSDRDGDRICTSLPDAVSDPTNYTVLNFTEPNRDDSKEIRNEANFTKGYLYEFLGWSTEKSAAKSWAADNLGVEYAAKEDREDTSTTENGKINLTTVTTTETVENGQKYYDLHLYAKGSVMQYTLICKQKAEGNGGYDAWSGSDKNRLTGWCEIKLTGGVTIGNKQGYEFKGWSRKDINGNLVDEDNPIQWDTYVRINKNDPYGKWDPNFTGKDGLNRPIKGKQTLILYPVWKLKDPEVIAPGAEGDIL